MSSHSSNTADGSAAKHGFDATERTPTSVRTSPRLQAQRTDDRGAVSAPQARPQFSPVQAAESQAKVLTPQEASRLALEAAKSRLLKSATQARSQSASPVQTPDTQAKGPAQAPEAQAKALTPQEASKLAIEAAKTRLRQQSTSYPTLASPSTRGKPAGQDPQAAAATPGPARAEVPATVAPAVVMDAGMSSGAGVSSTGAVPPRPPVSGMSFSVLVCLFVFMVR
jgi:hypothetical protein